MVVGGGCEQRDGTVSAEWTPAIPLSHLFLYINKTVVLLKGQVEAAGGVGFTHVTDSVNTGQDGEGSLLLSLTLL